MLLLYYAALLYFALLATAKTTPVTVVYSSSYRYPPKEGNIYGISHSHIDTNGMVDPEWSFKAFYIGPVPGHPRLVFVAAVSLFNYLPEGLKPRRTIDLVENEFASIFEEERFLKSQTNVAHAQVVAKKDLELIRDQRLLENNIDKMKLTGEALNRIRTNMVTDFWKRPADFNWINWINWPSESEEAPGIHYYPAAGRNSRAKKEP